MKNMLSILLLLLLTVNAAFAQSTVSLDSCYAWARQNYPNLKQGELWQEITSLKQENIKTNYLPQLSLNGQASYQSDVVKIDIPMPGISIPTVPKDQYKLYADFRQTIWDGGVSGVNKQLENAILKNNLSELEIELYKLNEQIAQAFFVALTADKQAEVLSAQKKVLTERLKLVQSGIKNGVAEKSAALVIQAELLNLEQNEIQLLSGKNSVIQMLSILTGKTIVNEDQLVFDERESFPNELNRPELQLFANQSAQLETQMQLLDKTRNPKFFGFGQAGYGKPGLNMLNDSFDTYYLLGVGFTWNAFDWKNTTRQKQVLQLQQEMLVNQEETFTQNLQLLLVQQNEQILKLKKMLDTDQQMVELRTEITKAAASKLENETITASDFIQEVQAETVAKINMELHKIQLNEAREKYGLILGK